MKQYSHAWIAFMAVKRLDTATIPAPYDKVSGSLVRWFKDHRDFVLQGAWYPDAVIKDMATSHVLKYKPDTTSDDNRFKKLPQEYHLQDIGKASNLYNQPYTIESGNLPDRCEAIAHSIVDNLKMQHKEDKGSPIAPTNNHVATLFFMLSHYIADAHMPLHCDARQFSSNDNIHGYIENEWEKKIKRCYDIDYQNKRYFYDPKGYPLEIKNDPVLDWVENNITTRPFTTTYGAGNNNTWDFMSAITQYSYLTAYSMIPEQYDENNLTTSIFEGLNTGYTFEDYSKYILIDAIDSIARVWLRVWNRYQDWKAR